MALILDVVLAVLLDGEYSWDVSSVSSMDGMFYRTELEQTGVCFKPAIKTRWGKTSAVFNRNWGNDEKWINLLPCVNCRSWEKRNAQGTICCTSGVGSFYART